MNNKPTDITMDLFREKSPFGKLQDGSEIFKYTIANNRGLRLVFTDLGGIITSLLVPDREGKPGDVVLGFDDLQGYLQEHPYFGAVIGRYGNRIAHGRFELDGVTYELAKNLGSHHLHGGVEGFDRKVWKTEWAENEYGQGASLYYRSPHMEEGYPGNLEVTVSYLLNDRDELTVMYEAATDRTTVLNLTQHTYFNLNGMRSDVRQHEVRLHASKVLNTDGDLIPTGEMSDVQGTPLDFTRFKAIGEDIDDPALRKASGYDHCFVVDREGEGLVPCAEVYEPETGRVMQVRTTEPGFQFYTGNHIGRDLSGKGFSYGPGMGFCIETQHYPDSPNHPQFPVTTLRPDQKFRSVTQFAFSHRQD